MIDNVDQNTILNCGIFAFDDENKLIGIRELTPQKNISARHRKEIPSHRLKLMADEIAASINSYLKGPKQRNTLKSVIDNFENELDDTMKRWNLDTGKLEPHYSNLRKKAKRIISSNLNKHAKTMAKSDTKPRLKEISPGSKHKTFI